MNVREEEKIEWDGNIIFFKRILFTIKFKNQARNECGNQ